MTSSLKRILTFIRPNLPSSSLTDVDWLSVLKLSTLWEFGKVREKAIAALSRGNMDPVEKVLNGKTYRVGELLLRGYMALVERSTSLSYEDAEKLGFEIAFRIGQKREEGYRKRLDHNVKDDGPSLEQKICDTFRAELLDAGHSGECSRPAHWSRGFGLPSGLAHWSRGFGVPS